MNKILIKSVSKLELNEFDTIEFNLIEIIIPYLINQN